MPQLEIAGEPYGYDSHIDYMTHWSSEQVRRVDV